MSQSVYATVLQISYHHLPCFSFLSYSEPLLMLYNFGKRNPSLRHWRVWMCLNTETGFILGLSPNFLGLWSSLMLFICFSGASSLCSSGSTSLSLLKTHILGLWGPSYARWSRDSPFSKIISSLELYYICMRRAHIPKTPN